MFGVPYWLRFGLIDIGLQSNHVLKSITSIGGFSSQNIICQSGKLRASRSTSSRNYVVTYFHDTIIGDLSPSVSLNAHLINCPNILILEIYVNIFTNLFRLFFSSDFIYQ